MAGRVQTRVIRHNRVSLYEDKVIRKTAKFQADEELTLSTAKVTRTLGNGEDSVCVELAGYKEKPSKLDPVAKFQISLSGAHWTYLVDERSLRLTVSTTDPTGRLKEKHVLKMRSREQLAAWAAEIIQASTFHPEHILQRCFHVTVPACTDGSLETSDDQLDALLQVRHPNDTQLVARDPLSLADVRCWDLSELEMFSFDFIPDLRLCLKPRESRKGDYVFFLSTEVVHQALTFMESFFELKLPKLFETVKRRVFQRATAQGAVINAVSYRLNHVGSPIKISRSNSRGSATSEGERAPPVPRGACYRSVLPYAVTKLFQDRDPELVSLLGTSPGSPRNKKIEEEEKEPKPPKEVNSSTLDESGESSAEYVEMAPNELDADLTAESKESKEDSNSVGYQNTLEHFPSISTADGRDLLAGSQHPSNSDSASTDGETDCSLAGSQHASNSDSASTDGETDCSLDDVTETKGANFNH